MTSGFSGSISNASTPLPLGNPEFTAAQVFPPSLLFTIPSWPLTTYTVAEFWGSIARSWTQQDGEEFSAVQLAPPSVLLYTAPYVPNRRGSFGGGRAIEV